LGVIVGQLDLSVMSQQSTIDYLTSQNEALVKAGVFQPKRYK
jgi:hypothetical protein